MISLWADILAIVFLLIGLFFMFVGALGVLRLPDVYHRLHGATKGTTLGLLGLLLAAMLHLGEVVVIIKASLTLLFAFVAVPVGSHILSRVAMFDRAQQWEGTLSDEHADDRLGDDAGHTPANDEQADSAAKDGRRSYDQPDTSRGYSRASSDPAS